MRKALFHVQLMACYLKFRLVRRFLLLRLALETVHMMFDEASTHVQNQFCSHP